MLISQLEYIAAVARFQHFGKAAEHCHVTQPTLSMQIQKLEDEMDLQIFDRSKKPILITTQGRAFIKQAEVIIHESKKLQLLTKSAAAQLSGDFRLAIIPTLAPYLLPLFASKIEKKLPCVNFTVAEMQTSAIIESLANDDIDGGILVTPLVNPNIYEIPLFYEPFYFYSKRGYLKNKKNKINENDLKSLNMWLLEEGHCLRNQVVQTCTSRVEDQVISNIDFESGSLETLKNLISATGGYTLIPGLALTKQELNDKTLDIRSFQKPIPSRQVSIVHSRKVLKMKIIEELEDIIVGCLPEKIRQLRKKDLQVVDV